MLKALRIQNIILLEEAEIELHDGFTVLSGETGAGKSAVLKALGLVLGERAESGLVRKGAAKARVEAAFEIDSLPGVKRVLEEVGIDHTPGELLLIRRDLTADGKSRAFVNNTMAQLTLLKRLSALLLDLVGQHANLRLISPEYQRDVLDLFGGLQEERRAFAASFHALQEKRQELDALNQSEAERLRELDQRRAELEELEGAATSEGEEERLFAEYSRLSHAEELLSTLQEVLNTVQESPLKSAGAHLDKCVTLDPTLKAPSDQLQSVCLELDELGYTLQTYASALDADPATLETLNTRLTQLNTLKRKYGVDLGAYLEQTRERLNALEGADTRIEELEREVEGLQKECDELAGELSRARKKTARKLEKRLVAELRPLNMQGAKFDVSLNHAERSPAGDESIEFLFAPNVGEGGGPVRQCASGGELSRLLLALKTALAGLELTPTLVFDEIDANIGGETALLVGQKLAAIGAERQVICITHLPQVAREANHHFAIAKSEVGGRTLSSITPLSKQERRLELARMSGSTP